MISHAPQRQKDPVSTFRVQAIPTQLANSNPPGVSCSTHIWERVHSLANAIGKTISHLGESSQVSTYGPKAHQWPTTEEL